jgi:long-chain acyl-CoA synthetase
VTPGYWNRPELNAQRRAHGWFRTNDIGRRHADGSVDFLGPKGRMIKSGAENIYLVEVEACLRQHPAVQDVAAIGVPDPDWGHSVRAVVQLRPGHSAGEADIVEHCRARIASYKKPRSVVFVSELPRAGFAVDLAKVAEMHGQPL